MDQNNFALHPICRNPMTGEWPSPGDEMLNLNSGIRNASIIHRDTEMIEIPDEWLLPVAKKDLPPKKNQKVVGYLLSEKGFEANKDRLAKGFKYKKCSFDEYANCILTNARHYCRTLEKRRKKSNE